MATADSGNPSNLDAVTGKVLTSGTGELVFPPSDRVELTNNAPITTAATNTTPFGFATADQADDIVASLREIRAALITVGICIDSTANAD